MNQWLSSRTPPRRPGSPRLLRATGSPTAGQMALEMCRRTSGRTCPRGSLLGATGPTHSRGARKARAEPRSGSREHLTPPADRPGALIARHIYTEPGISPPYPVIEPNYALRLREAVRTNGFVRFSNRTELPGVDAILNFAEVRSGIFVQAPCGGAVGVTTTRASKFWDDRHVASVREATRGLCAGACGLTAP
jgi:hypothetical protein